MLEANAAAAFLGWTPVRACLPHPARGMHTPAPCGHARECVTPLAARRAHGGLDLDGVLRANGVKERREELGDLGEQVELDEEHERLDERELLEEALETPLPIARRAAILETAQLRNEEAEDLVQHVRVERRLRRVDAQHVRQAACDEQPNLLVGVRAQTGERACGLCVQLVLVGLLELLEHAGERLCGEAARAYAAARAQRRARGATRPNEAGARHGRALGGEGKSGAHLEAINERLLVLDHRGQVVAREHRVQRHRALHPRGHSQAGRTFGAHPTGSGF